MKRLLIALLLLAAPAWAEEPFNLARMSGPMLGAGGSAAVCTESTPSVDNSEIGYLSVGAASANGTVGRMYCSLYAADCTGTLGTANIYISDAGVVLNTKISVYSTTDTSSSSAPTNGALVGASSAIGSNGNSTPMWKSSVTSGGSVTSASKYWLCYHTDDAGSPAFYYDSGLNRYYTTVDGAYTTPPSTLPAAAVCVGSGDPYSCCTGSGAGCTWTSAANRQVSVFVGIK